MPTWALTHPLNQRFCAPSFYSTSRACRWIFYPHLPQACYCCWILKLLLNVFSIVCVGFFYSFSLSNCQLVTSRINSNLSPFLFFFNLTQVCFGNIWTQTCAVFKCTNIPMNAWWEFLQWRNIGRLVSSASSNCFSKYLHQFSKRKTKFKSVSTDHEHCHGRESAFINLPGTLRYAQVSLQICSAAQQKKQKKTHTKKHTKKINKSWNKP